MTDIKGTAFIARRTWACRRFGEPRWEAFLAQLAVDHPIFRAPILATSPLTVDAYVALQEGLAAAFLKGDKKPFWTMGYESGKWALTEGPYRSMAAVGVEGFLPKMPLLWSAMLSSGTLTASLTKDGRAVDVTAIGAPSGHVALEQGAMGFAAAGLELTHGKPVRVVSAVNKRGATGFTFEYRFALE